MKEITFKYAVKKAKRILRKFVISSCWEDKDGWIFVVAVDKKRNPVFMAPIKIFKNGKVDFLNLNFYDRLKYFDELCTQVDMRNI